MWRCGGLGAASPVALMAALAVSFAVAGDVRPRVVRSTRFGLDSLRTDAPGFQLASPPRPACARTPVPRPSRPHSGPTRVSRRQHTVFCAECTNNFDYKSLGVYWSHALSGMPGKVTRLLACDPSQLAKYKGLNLGPTFVHKNHARIVHQRHPEAGGGKAIVGSKPSDPTHILLTCLRAHTHLLTHLLTKRGAGWLKVFQLSHSLTHFLIFLPSFLPSFLTYLPGKAPFGSKPSDSSPSYNKAASIMHWVQTG